MNALRAHVVTEIMKLVRSEPISIGKPTIDELERILNSEDPGRINLAPDGSATLRPPSHTTVGNVADAVLPLILEACAKIAEAHDADAGIKKLGKANYKYASDEARAEFAAEARGEKIASEIIAKAIRALKV